MDGNIVFCNDGILRFESYSKSKSLVPLILIQEAKKLSSSRCFLQHLNSNAKIEAGSTMGSFILCLEPWADLAYDLVDRNVPAYIQMLKKPSSANNSFDRIEICRNIGVVRDVYYGKMPEDMDIIEWINTPKEPKLLDTFNLSTEIDISGYCDGDESNYSMSMTNIHELKNVPLILNRTTHFMDYTNKRGKEKGYIINESTDGVKSIDGLRYIETKAETSFTMQELIEVVFIHGLFYESPNAADQTKEEVTASLEALKKAKENTEQKDNETGEMRIEVADGAFSGIIEHYDREQMEWNSIEERIVANSKYPLRIGEIKEDEPKDKRLSGRILS